MSRLRPTRRWIAVLAALCAAAVLSSWAFVELSTAAGEGFGVDQLHIRRTAGGHLLDLRYQVVDSQRAASLLAEESMVYVIHAKSGKRLVVPSTPKTGPLRNTGVPQAGRSYFALFTNPGGLAQPGDRVTVVLGALSTELTVE